MKAAIAASAIGGLDVWKICDKLSVVQAASLILGLDPSEYEDVGDRSSAMHPTGYAPVFQALKDAVIAGQLKASVVSKDLSSVLVIGMIPEEKRIIEMSETDWQATTVQVADLKEWLVSKSMKPEFFFSEDQFNIHNKDSEFYASKLAAAVRAWEAVTMDKALLKNKSPRKALTKWLEDHATVYGLSKQAIDEISKVANWKPEGGVPGTPSKSDT